LDWQEGVGVSQYELILFDFDGTLADSLNQGLAHYNALASQFGFLPVTDIEAARQMKTKAFFKAHRIPLRRLPRLYREFLRLQQGYMPLVPWVRGVKEVVVALSRHYRLGILSSNSEENIRACLRNNGVETLFDFVLSHTSIFGKHKPMKKILKTEKVPRDRVVYVGDEIRDMKACVKAKIDGCAATWGIHPERFLLTEKPRFVARHPMDLLQILGVDPDFAPHRPVNDESVDRANGVEQQSVVN
jgi:phosphoglycolate phosphatase